MKTLCGVYNFNLVQQVKGQVKRLMISRKSSEYDIYVKTFTFGISITWIVTGIA